MATVISMVKGSVAARAPELPITDHIRTVARRTATWFSLTFSDTFCQRPPNSGSYDHGLYCCCVVVVSCYTHVDCCCVSPVLLCATRSGRRVERDPGGDPLSSRGPFESGPPPFRSLTGPSPPSGGSPCTEDPRRRPPLMLRHRSHKAANS